jgi:hypothetical protein
MHNDIADSAMFFTAAVDQDAVDHRRLVVQATVALAGTWPFLAAASSADEFEHRLALAQEQIEARTPEHIREEVVAGLREKWAAMRNEEQARTAMLRTAARKVEAVDGVLPQAYVHVHSHGDGDEAYHQIDLIGSPTFMQTIARVNDLDDAMVRAREYALPSRLPLYRDGKYVEGKLLTPDEEFYDHRTGRWTKASTVLSPRDGARTAAQQESDEIPHPTKPSSADPTSVKNAPGSTNYQPDPAQAWRYHYPIPAPTEAFGGQPTGPGSGSMNFPDQAAGSSIGADGFPIDVAQGESAGAAAAIQNQLTPGQWVVPPDAGWPAASLPNAATGQVTGSRHQATEGAVPTPGANPNYFAQGTQGMTGPPQFPPDPSGDEPKTDNHLDDGYFGGQPPVSSSGSAEGRVDGGYTHQASLVLQEMPGRYEAHMYGADSFPVGAWPSRQAALADCDAFAEQYAQLHRVAVRKVFSDYQYVKKRGDKWVITQKGTGKVLSEHDSEEDAKASFRAMMQSKHGTLQTTAEEKAPYRLKQDSDGWHVVNKDGERKNKKPFKSKGEARNFQKALYANVPGAPESAKQDEERKGKRSSLEAPPFGESAGERTSARRYVPNPDMREPSEEYEAAIERGECTCGFGRHPDDERPVPADPNCPVHHGVAHDLVDEVNSASPHERGITRAYAARGWEDAAAQGDSPTTHRMRGVWDAERGRNYSGDEDMSDPRHRAYREDWDAVHNRVQASTDGKIVGLCDHCNLPVRYHTENGGHLRHLHNDSHRCADGKTSTAMRRTEGGVEYRLPIPKDSPARQASFDPAFEGQTWHANGVNLGRAHSLRGMPYDPSAPHPMAGDDPGYMHPPEGRGPLKSHYQKKFLEGYDRGYRNDPDGHDEWGRPVPERSSSRGPASAYSYGHQLGDRHLWEHGGPHEEEYGRELDRISAPNRAFGHWDEHSNQEFRQGYEDRFAGFPLKWRESSSRTGAVLEAPTPENPTGRGGDDFRAKTWEGLVHQRPMQPPEERNANTPTLPQEPIRTGPNINTPQSPGWEKNGPEEDDDEDENRDEDDD